MIWCYLWLLCLWPDGFGQSQSRFPRLSFSAGRTCTYSYELAVHTARGSRSTESDGFQVHALVDVTSVSSERHDLSPLHLLKLDIREPRLRRTRGARVLVNHPVNEEFEEQLSKPFYFRQHEHGAVADVLVPEGESPEMVAFKKGVAGVFQVNLEKSGRWKKYTVKEHDDSGSYNAEYKVLNANESHAEVHRRWTNHDYEEFADGTPVKGKHKVQSQHDAHVYVKEGNIHTVHRTNKAYFRPSRGHPRADNSGKFLDQDIEMSTRGYNKLALRSCSQLVHHRRRRSIPEENSNTDNLKRENLIFKEADQIKWKDIGGGKQEKTRPLYELIRCFTDKSVKEREIGDCSREMNFLIRNNEEAFTEVCNVIKQRTHENITTWAVLVGNLAWHGQRQAQDVLAHALRSNNPRPLSKEEYESLLEGIFYLPKGPIHHTLYDALMETALKGDKHKDVTNMAMLVLSGLSKRAKLAGYNDTLDGNVAELIHSSYRNKSTLYQADTEEHESYLRDHIWAFGNLGHVSGLAVILEHADHDSSDIRTAVMSAMRKLPQEHTDHHLLKALNDDEHNDVKAAVVNVFTERHQDLNGQLIKALEDAFWHAEDGDSLDSAVQELLQNHGKHPNALHLKKKRSFIKRHKRALIPLLRPREFQLGPSKRWEKTFGGKWLGAEAVMQFVNQVRLRVGIFGGSFEVDLDNVAVIRAHILKFGFDIVKGKAAFKASASFKNDFPKDLIHTVADFGDKILRNVDSVTNVIVKQIEKVKMKLMNFIPLSIDKFSEFVNKVIQFVNELLKPLKPVKLIGQVISYTKNVLSRLKHWRWMLKILRNIKSGLDNDNDNDNDNVFSQSFAAFDETLKIVDRITVYLPHKLPATFRIEELFRWLKGVSVEYHPTTIADYFKSLEFQTPRGFQLQLPFKHLIRYTFSLEQFQKVIMRLLNFANKFLDFSSLLDALKIMRLPTLRLPELESRHPTSEPQRGFQFGLGFDWKRGLRFDIDFKQFLSTLHKFGRFFTQFNVPGFNLEKFFDDILPGKTWDLSKIFKDFSGGGSPSRTTDPAKVLQDFLKKFTLTIDLNFGNVTAISDLVDFFRQLGPEMVGFSKKSAHKLCDAYRSALNFSNDFKNFGDSVEQQSIRVLQEVDKFTKVSLSEVMNFTVVVDSLADEIERKFRDATLRFMANSFRHLNPILQKIQELANEVVDFANGTTSKVTGACSKTADFSAKIIDAVQNATHKALGELGTFIGPIAADVAKVGQEVKTVVKKVETWYKRNMAARVGKISRIAQFLSDFLAIINTKKGFMGTVRDVANKINEVLRHLTNLPEYSTKAQQVADDVINFSNRVTSFKDEIKKLDLRKKFGIAYDEKVRDICTKFNLIARDSISRFANFDVVQEVNTLFTKEAELFISKVVSKLTLVKEPFHKIQGEIQSLRNIVREVITVLIDLKPFTQNFSPVLETVSKLPNCKQMKAILIESTKPCVRKALSVGKYTLEKLEEFRKGVLVLYDMVPLTWKNVKVQKCIKGRSCISNDFIDQARDIKDKTDFLIENLQEASGFSDMLQRCKQGVQNMTAVMDTIRYLMVQVNNFSLRDDFEVIKSTLQRVAGRTVQGGDKDGHVKKRSTENAQVELQRIIDYVEMAKRMQAKIRNLVESSFKKMSSVYDDAIGYHVQKIRDVREKLKVSFELWREIKDASSVMQALDSIVKGASDFADNLNEVTSSLSNPILNVLTNITQLSDKVKPYLEKYGKVLVDATDKVNDFLDKVTDFLNKIQLRQRGLDLRDYKPWHQYPYCSESVCVRSIRRSSSLYYSTIFVWKFPHLDDLSSMDGTGRWLVPGLFDDFKVQGISQLTEHEMLLGMHGVVRNEDKASLLVVTNLRNGGSVKKIIQLRRAGSPFSVTIGGVAIARDVIWVSDSKAKKIYRVWKSSVTSSLSSLQPSWITVSGEISVEGLGSSVSYDRPSNFLWVTDGKAGKSYGYQLSANGDLIDNGATPEKVIHVSKGAQGLSIIRQFGDTFACVSICEMVPGFQCKLEFHNVSSGLKTNEETLSRVVRTPSGLESVQMVDSFRLVVAFSSGTFADKEKIAQVGGDVEDRYYRMKLPILKTGYGIHENCLMFRLMSDWIIKPKKLFPIGEMHCGSRRKRSLVQQLLDNDVYSDELEHFHGKTSRKRRDVSDFESCVTLSRSDMEPRYHPFFPEKSKVIIVFGIPVKLFVGAGGHYVVNWQGQLCMKDKILRFGLIPGAWVSVYAGASVPLLVVEAGITIEAVILDTYLLPELRVKIDKWPLQACIELKMRMTPLRIKVYLWYRLIEIKKVKAWLFGCSIKFGWGRKRTFDEWTWSARAIERTLFTNCKKDVDRTPPTAGTCEAKQVSDTKYLVQWHGFHEDTSIKNYRVRIGSIEGSEDDFGTWAGTSLSMVVSGLSIMHGRDVYVSVFATNAQGMESRLTKCSKFVAKRSSPVVHYVYDGADEGNDLDYQSNDYAVGMNYILKSKQEEVMSVQWGISSSSSCTLDSSEADIQPMTTLGDSTAAQASDLQLNHGNKYYTRVLVTNKLGMRTIACSDGLVIDATPPKATYVWDGAGEEDTDFIPSTTRFRARFAPFNDSESPIAKYEWRLMMKDSNTAVTPFKEIPLNQTSPMMDKLSLIPGVSYYSVLRGTNSAGLQSSIKSNGFVPDNTPPFCPGQVIDVSDKNDEDDADFVRELRSIQAKWKCIDNESGIQKQIVGLGTYPGGDDVILFSNTSISKEDSGYYVNFSSLTIRPKVRYHVTVKVFNGAKLKRTITSDGILMGITLPAVAAEYIKDGSKGRDKNFTSERFSFSAHWEQAFTDAESGLVEYRVGLGTKPGLVNTKEFTNVGSSTSATLSGLLLESGRRYYVTVMVCNAVGMCTSGSSNGAVVDFVPPHTGDVITGYQGPPQYYQWLTKSAWARWGWCPADENGGLKQTDYLQCSNDSFYDIHSGITSFGISVVSLKTDTLLAPVKEVGRVKLSGRSISMGDGIYSVLIEARDHAGVRSHGLSNTFIVDSSPPVITHVQHGVSGDSMQYTNASFLTFTAYFEMEDDLSKITEYKVGIGSYPGADDVILYQSYRLPFAVSSLHANWESDHTLNLENGRHYFVTVWAFNGAGLFTIKSSLPLIVDSEPPSGGIVLDGWDFSDVKYYSYPSIYRVHWRYFTDVSGIRDVSIGISSYSDCSECDIQAFVDAQPVADSHVMSSLNLTSGMKYYGCVKFTDKAGNEGIFPSDGVLVDTTPPVPGEVTDGRPGEDREVQTEGSILKATWNNFTEQETTIVGYKLAFGTTPGSSDIQDFTDVGLVTSSASSRLKVSKLTVGQRYYASVVAYNVLGVPSAVTSSNGVMVDSTPPTFTSIVYDGSDSKADLQSISADILSMTWHCEDPETSVDYVQVAFGLQPGGSDVVNFTTLASNQETFSVKTALRPGYRYFATVRCVNKVGLRTLATSDGVVYDTTPPKGLFIVDGDYQASTLNVSLKWKFVDPESSIQQYVIYIFSKAHDINARGPFTHDGSVTSSIINLVRPLHHGVKYYLNVTAVNLPGLKTTLDSDGFTVDSTPATCDQVWDGDKSYPHDVQYVPKTNKMTISWNCHDDESSIDLYRYSVKNSVTGEVILPFHAIKMKVNLSGTAVITGEGKRTAVYKEGGAYAVGIELTNGVQMKSVYWTNGVVVDSSPPTLKDLKLSFNHKTDSLYAMWKALDQESGLKRLAWGIGKTPDSTDVKNFTEVTTSTTNTSITNIPLSLGRTYFLSLVAVNKAGLSSTTASNGVVIDRTAPTAGIVAVHYVFPKSYDRSKNYVSGASFVAAWTGFIDSESGVDQYSWAVGTNLQDIKQQDDSLYTVITDEDSVGGTVIENQTLSSNTTYFVCIRATNGVGLQKTDCSLGMLVILGKFSPGTVNDGPVTSARDIDFQMDDKAIWAHWDGFKDPNFGISRYDWCIRDQPLGMSNVCQWPYMEIHHLKTSAHRFHNLTLSHGAKYYVTVKAENIRGETVSSTSDGVTVDRTPPVSKAIHVSPATGKETLYVTSPSAPVVTWSMEDPESGIKYFLVGVGSFPQQDDVMSFSRVSGLSRSVDLDTLNLTLSEGLSFYVTVTGVNMLGLETTLTSQQVVVDWSPPKAGHVIDGNKTFPESDRFVDIDYQREGGVLSGHWEGFEDPESEVVEYRWCIGTTQLGKCDIHELTAVGLETSFHHPVALREGLRYYVTIEATNGAGLKENVYSDGVTLDASPPVFGNIDFETALQSDAHEILFSWTKVTDEESGVSELAWCAGTSAGKDDLVSWIQIDPSKRSVTYSFSKPLTSGTFVFITLKAWNGAGMTSQITSEALVIDSTPPEQGNVIVGSTPGLIYLRQGEAIKAEWNGFADVESGVKHYEWAVCHSFSTDDCITPYVYVEKETSVTNDALDLKPGVSYVFVVRAYNQVYLFTDVVSNPFILNGKTSQSGSVLDGDELGKDISVQSSTSFISANWQAFSDLHGRIVSSEICVGSKPEICDIRGFINVGVTLAGTISGLQLNHTGQYFVTIQATNAAGYQEIATSNGVRVDSTPPVGKAIRDGRARVDIDLQPEDSFISANWDEFEDPESGIAKYEWCAGTKQGSCDVIAQTDVTESTTVQQQVSPPLTTGMKVFVTLTVYNEAGGVTNVFTNGVTVDNTAPVISKVLDLQVNKTDDDIDFVTAKDHYCMSWNASDLQSGIGSSEVSVCSKINPEECLVQRSDVGNRTEFCMADLEFEEGVEYTAIVRVTNIVGLSSKKSSDGFVVDSTAPSIGDVFHLENKAVEGERFTHSVISVKWDGFEDKESGVSKYLCCVGTRPGECSVRNFTEIRNKTSFSLTDFSLRHGVTYFVSVVAENHAGLTSAVTASDGVTVDRSGPVGGQRVFDGGDNGVDIDIQQSASSISANWNGFEDSESDVIEVTWCAGTIPGKCNLVTQSQIEPSETSVHRVIDESLIIGQRYYITVHATNGAGVMTTITSDGVTVDTTPPLRGQVMDGNLVDVDIAYGEDDVTARWFNFSDRESGVQSYEVAVCDARIVSRCPQAYIYVGKTTNITITGLDLENGVQYVVKVRATNHAGLQTEASSDGFTVDFSPPSVGKVWEGLGIEDVNYQSDPSQFNVSWLPFRDQESGIVTYEVCLGVSAGNCDILNMVDVRNRLNYSFNNLNLSHGFSYYATVRGTNAVGLSSVMSSNGVLLDLTPPRIIEENNAFVNTTLHSPLTARNDTNTATSRGYHVRFTCSSERLSAEWQECEDPESKIHGNKWCVGTAAAKCDIWPMTSTGLNQRASAIVKSVPFDTGLFASVYVVNGVGLKVRLFSNKCTVNSVPPNISDVHDATEDKFDSSDVDWKSVTNSLSVRWKIVEHSHDKGRMRIQMAVIHPSSNISTTRLLQSRSWHGEPIVQDFMDVLPWQRNITIRTDKLENYQIYKGVIRAWNGDDIYSEKATDGIKIEPDPPAKRKLLVKDSTAEKERARLWPLLHLPPVNKSAIDPEIMYISSPEELVLEVRSSGNATDSTAPDDSSTKEFQVFVVRANTNESKSNTEEERQLLKSFPAFANPEGPCCANISLNRPTIFSDVHVKPTVPSQSFGSSVALLSDDYLVVTSVGRGDIFSIQDGFKFHSTMFFNPSEVVGLAQHANRTAFLSSSEVHVYDSTLPAGTVKITTINNCKIPVASNCSINQTWADSLQHVIGIHDHVVAIRGRFLSTNTSVVGLFQEERGIWTFATILGHSEQGSSFGHSISLNEHLIAVAYAGQNSSCAFLYTRKSYSLIRKVCLNNTSNLAAHISLHLTETDILIMALKEKGSVNVFQLDIRQKSYHSICSYETQHEKYLSGSLDTVSENNQVIIALGIQTPEGRDGVRLIGFDDVYNSSVPSNTTSRCNDLGRAITPGSRLRVDDGIPRASVSFRGNMIVFGVPSVLTWPDLSKNDGTGRVYITAYCPRDHVRTREPDIGFVRSFTCRPCKNGRRSFGGFVTECSVCENRTCPSPSRNTDKSTFEIKLCDFKTCSSSSSLDNTTWGITTKPARSSFFVEGAQNVYTVMLLEITRANISTVSYSESFIIDYTPPIPGTVYDGLGSDQNRNCSQNTTFGEDNQCSSRDFQDTDVDYTNNTAEIHARWIDFLDNQSNIIEYFWCVGSRPMRDDIRECESTGLRPNGSHYGLSLQQNETYYVTVVACNGAHRCSAAYSDGVTIDTTPPVMEFVRDGIMGPDMDFQAFLDLIFAYFYGTDLGSGIRSYEVAWGTAPNVTNIKDFEEVTNTTVWFSRIKDGGLEKGKRYYASVRATNGAGLLSDIMSSNGIVVGKSEYIFDNKTSASFFFDTVNVNLNGTREDGGVGATYGTLDVPEGAVKSEVKLRCYSLDEKTQQSNVSDEGPISDTKQTTPKHFKLGNYSFQIKALDPETNTVQEGYHFEKPITVSMFYDVDNLVKANKDVVNDELEKEDIDPVLYLWDPKNESWFDASLTCPEPWSHVNRSIKLLTVHVCHLTQFAFFWTFRAQNGLMLFNKNSSVYNQFGQVNVIRKDTVAKLELPIKRAKGSSGNVSVTWSLLHNTSDASGLVWPSNGIIQLKEGQWNSSIVVNVADKEIELSERVVWVQLDNTTGGAVLGTRDQTRTKLIITSNVVEKVATPGSGTPWVTIGATVGSVILLGLIIVLFLVFRSHIWRSKSNLVVPFTTDTIRSEGMLGLGACRTAYHSNPTYDITVLNQPGDGGIPDTPIIVPDCSKDTETIQNMGSFYYDNPIYSWDSELILDTVEQGQIGTQAGKPEEKSVRYQHADLNGSKIRILSADSEPASESEPKIKKIRAWEDTTNKN